MNAQIVLRGVSKRFSSRADHSRSLMSFLWSGLRGGPAHQKFALQDINLEIGAGERVAILGHNGAGKTTLLRLIADTLVPCSGEVRVLGSVAPIAGISTGYDNRLSGRDNLILRAALFGLSHAEIHNLLPRVIEFAELHEAIDLPVQTYSSGMLARLGFSLSIHLEAQIYLVDEGMVAGDRDFRVKARRAMEERIRAGGTWVIVTHDLEPVRDFCQRGYVLEQGRIVKAGPLEELTAGWESPVLASPAPL